MSVLKRIAILALLLLAPALCSAQIVSRNTTPCNTSNGAVQFDNGGSFGCTTLIYNAGANSYIAAGNSPELFLHSAATGLFGQPANFAIMLEGEAAGASNNFASQATSPTAKTALAMSAQGVIVGNSGTGSCFNGIAGTADCALGGYFSAQDTPADTANGQDLIAVHGIIGLNKASPHTVRNATAFRAASPENSAGIIPAPETATNFYGFEVMDLDSLASSTTETAGVKIHAITAPTSGNKFSIKADTGSGVASFGDGIALPASCPTCVTSAASLTSNAVVLGAGGQATQTLTFLTTNGTNELDIGVAGEATSSTLGFPGKTSGKATIIGPDVAGTSTNPFSFSNAISTIQGNRFAPSFQNGQVGEGMYRAGASPFGTVLVSGSTDILQASFGFVSLHNAYPLSWCASGGVDGCTLNTGISSISAGVIGVGNGTQGDVSGTIQAAKYSTGTNCSSSATPAVCGSAAAGSVAVPTGATPTLVIDTTAVTANSQILLNIDESLGTKLSVTCNTTLATLVHPVVTARTGGTSFTIQINATLATNPACVSYAIVN